MSSRLLACISSMRPIRSLLVAGRVDDAGAGRQLARIDAAEGDGADERVVHDLEREQRQRLLVVGLADDLVAVLSSMPLIGGHVERRRQIVDDRVEQRLHALVLEGRAAQHRIERAGQHRLADQPLQRRLVRLVAVEIGGHARRRRARRRLRPSSRDIPWPARRGRPGCRRRRTSRRAISSFQTTPFICTRSTTPLKLFSAPIGSWIAIGLAPRRSTMSARHLKKSAPVLSILLAKTMRGTLYLSPWRQTVSVCGSTPWLRVEHAHGAVEHAQRTLDLDGEVDVAGGVDDVQALAVPERGGRGRGDGDAALLLLLHPVHRRGTFVHFADLVALAGVIEDALGRRGLAGVDMRHDTEVAVVLDGMLAGHGLFLQNPFVSPFTSDSARRRGWLPPSGARLHAS